MQYDLFVIGGGSGGVRAARLAAAQGARVALAERGALGGTCVNVGCVPKKLFVYAASFAEEAAAAPAFGWTQAVAGTMQWDVLRDNKNREIQRLNAVYEKLLTSAGVHLIAAEAQLVGERRVRAGNIEFHADKVLLAVGGAPVRLNIPGADMALLSDDMFYLSELPRRAVVVGGGYIALEFAGILAGLGVDTSLCFRADLPLRSFDEDLREHIATEIAARGVTVRAGVAPQKIIKQASGALRVCFAGGDDTEADLVMFASGRRPLTDNIGLEHTLVKPRANGTLPVNADYQTAADWLYAIGDVLDTPALTPVATAEAGVFVDRVFCGNTAAQLDYAHIPTAVFSRPPMATVGMSEEMARDAGINPVIYKSVFRPMKSGFSGNTTQTLMKLVTAPDNGRVLGAHMIGDDAAEIIQGLAVAIRLGATKQDFDSTIGVHPTSAEEFVTMRQMS
ncbi:glutathione-disulfide reductase [Candidatus Persebacteraceae bacterium Df01]|jgi:glutathione reductase (NADPH)|uniref:Glutathione-disulfide reductase n=1 Tax=Candidatus Doriopsillibacter californiensis TaxID=2970740 RepID=A0ABT7QLF8_9GAMM|nr:glutathione-disulfide reductase [Candidatus Persebacteraceae bacterium Df01]